MGRERGGGGEWLVERGRGQAERIYAETYVYLFIYYLAWVCVGVGVGWVRVAGRLVRWSGADDGTDGTLQVLETL